MLKINNVNRSLFLLLIANVKLNTETFKRNNKYKIVQCTSHLKSQSCQSPDIAIEATTYCPLGATLLTICTNVLPK